MIITIRRAEERDLPALGRMGAQLVRTHHDFDRLRFMQPAPNVEEGYAWFLGTQMAEPEATVLVAEGDGVVVGYTFAALEPQSWKDLREAAGFIHDLLVVEEARGHGVGTRLLEEAAAWLEARGAPRVMLGTAHANQAAQALFLRAGFRPTMIEMTRERRP
jgi:ribosomal protein S18 acetylase RimI-like enzyme